MSTETRPSGVVFIEASGFEGLELDEQPEMTSIENTATRVRELPIIPIPLTSVNMTWARHCPAPRRHCPRTDSRPTSTRDRFPERWHDLP